MEVPHHHWNGKILASEVSIGSCQLNGVEQEAYLRYVLAPITDHPINKIKDLLP
ncbi:TPA: transposase domain-containing protein [Klebsiella variicola subsp. variicola]|nr:transposase domain-containing protein [Klebsiella variicola subsp. variicola]